MISYFKANLERGSRKYLLISINYLFHWPSIIKPYKLDDLQLKGRTPYKPYSLVNPYCLRILRNDM